MKKIRRIAAAVLALALFTAALPAPAGAAECTDDRSIHSGAILDTDPSGGYEGDYVVIYNPSSDTVTGAGTGPLGGLIDTSIDPGDYWNGSGALPSGGSAALSSPIIDVDSELAGSSPEGGFPASAPERANWNVGATRNFKIYYYSPTGAAAGVESVLKFKVLFVGEHCRIWTCVNQSYTPLDLLGSDHARLIADEFDSKFGLMRSSFGDFTDSNGDGKVNMLFYDLRDGWSGFGQPYVAGYFWPGDFTVNSLPVIHVDTYPGLIAEDDDGGVYSDPTKCFSTLVHEFQHLINYSVTGGMHSWLNEAFSGAAEEICYPGSEVYPRIQAWQSYRYQFYDEVDHPIREFAFDPRISLHRGDSLAYWDNAENSEGLLARYAGVLFFSQYLYTRYGSTSIFKRIMAECKGNSVSQSLNALTAGTGWSLESIWRDYAITMIANSPAAGYGFRMNDGYDPSQWRGIESLYELLPAVVYNSTSEAMIKGGGFITVKPKNGVFHPPAGASSRLRYVGIRLLEHTPGDVNNDGKVDTEDALITLRCALSIITLDDGSRRRADIDNNGVIDTTDALLILRIALGIH